MAGRRSREGVADDLLAIAAKLPWSVSPVFAAVARDFYGVMAAPPSIGRCVLTYARTAIGLHAQYSYR